MCTHCTCTCLGAALLWADAVVHTPASVGLDESIDASLVVVAYIADGYFSSVGCMRELMRAMWLRKPLVALVESDADRGGTALAEIAPWRARADGALAEIEPWRARVDSGLPR